MKQERLMLLILSETIEKEAEIERYNFRTGTKRRENVRVNHIVRQHVSHAAQSKNRGCY